MAIFIFIPGAGGVAWDWHRVVALLQQRGHEAIAVDLPADDPEAGLADYADRVVAAIGARTNVVLVAHSLGGFTAPLVLARARVEMLVFVNAMIPKPGEIVGAWGDHTGSNDARIAAAKRAGYSADFDDATYFFHDVPPELAAQSRAHARTQTERVFGERCDFRAWPDVPAHVIAGRDDRLFPVEFQRRIARERLATTVDELPGGHLIALSNPQAVVEKLLELCG